MCVAETYVFTRVPFYPVKVFHLFLWDGWLGTRPRGTSPTPKRRQLGKGVAHHQHLERQLDREDVRLAVGLDGREPRLTALTGDLPVVTTAQPERRQVRVAGVERLDPDAGDAARQPADAEPGEPRQHQQHLVLARPLGARHVERRVLGSDFGLLYGHRTHLSD